LTEPQTLNWDNKSLTNVHGRVDKSARVRRMFNAIAPTYERINTWFSFGRDRTWRRAMVGTSEVRPNDRVLDVACGTGDVLRAFLRYAPAPLQLFGLDFATQMMRRGQATTADAIQFCGGDALRLPVADDTINVITCAFGVRNFQDLGIGLSEMHRVLRSGGRVIILEFSRPRNRMIRRLHDFYSGRIMPVVAGWISRDRTGAYRYLPQSVVSFADADQMCAHIRSAGFGEVTATPMTFGVVTIYRAVKVQP